MMKEYAAYDNLPAKQSRWEISLHNARDRSWMRQPASDKSSVGHTCWVWNAIILEVSARRADRFVRLKEKVNWSADQT